MRCAPLDMRKKAYLRVLFLCLQTGLQQTFAEREAAEILSVSFAITLKAAGEKKGDIRNEGIKKGRTDNGRKL